MENFENQASVFYFLTKYCFKESPFCLPSSLKIFLLFQIFQSIRKERKESEKEQKVIGLRLMRIRLKKSEIGRDFWTKVLGKRSAKFWNEFCYVILLKLFTARNSPTYWSQSERTSPTRDSIIASGFHQAKVVTNIKV